MDLLGSDVTKIAGAYSTFAGVLAGFVFAVMGYLLGSRSQRGSVNPDGALDATLSWSVLAFVGLSVASFLFALLSGEDRFTYSSNPLAPPITRVRPLALSIVGSGVLCIAILLLLLALIWLFKGEKTGDGLIKQLRATFYLTGLMTLYYLQGTFGAVSISQGQVVNDGVIAFIQLLAVFVLAVVFGEIFGYFLRKAKPKWGQKVRVGTQYILLFIIFASAGFFNFLANTDEAIIKTWHLLNYEWLALSILGFILLLCIANLPGWKTIEGSS